MKKLLLLFLTAVFAPQSGISQTACLYPPAEPRAIDDAPFTADEERQILDRLYELLRARIEIGELRDYINRDADIDARERELAKEQMLLTDEKIELAEAAADTQRERADMYEQLYRTLSAGPSFGCKVARVFTLGIYRCR